MASFYFEYANEDRIECKCHIKAEIQELKKYITILVNERNEGILNFTYYFPNGFTTVGF